jgi:hypothetical protein
MTTVKFPFVLRKSAVSKIKIALFQLKTCTTQLSGGIDFNCQLESLSSRLIALGRSTLRMQPNTKKLKSFNSKRVAAVFAFFFLNFCVVVNNYFFF